MKLLKISLISLLFFAGGCNATIEQTPVAFPGSVADKMQNAPNAKQELPDNVERREVVYNDGRVVNFLIIPISDEWNWHVANDPATAMTVQQWRDKLDARLVINGAYFTETMQPTGYYKQGGEATGTRDWPTSAEQENRAGYTGLVKILDNDLELIYLPDDYQEEPELNETAFLTFPTLLAGGENQISEDSKKFAKRTILAQDKKGSSYIIVTESGSPSLYETAEWLAGQPEQFEIAINLDGGASTGISYAYDGGVLDVASVSVPNVLYLKPESLNLD